MAPDIRCQRRQSNLCDNFPHILGEHSASAGDFTRERFRRGQQPACYGAEWGVVLVLGLTRAAMRLKSACLAQGSGQHAVEFRKSSGEGLRVALLQPCNLEGRWMHWTDPRRSGTHEARPGETSGIVSHVTRVMLRYEAG